jgi:uncharacterized protein (DUF1778 family)
MKTLMQDSAPHGGGRLQMRVSPQRRDLLEQAASLTGRTLTDFVLDSAEEAAVQVLHLTRRDSEFLVQALLNPEEPGPNLRRAAARYQDLMG